MNYNYRYRIDPDEPAEAELERHIDTCRQLYNHYLYELRNTEEYLSYTAMQNILPDVIQLTCSPTDGRFQGVTR